MSKQQIEQRVRQAAENVLYAVVVKFSHTRKRYERRKDY